MKINILRIILILLLLCTFFVIFGFSSQDGEASGGLSRNITNKILQISNKYNALGQEEKEQIANKTEKIIRKVAHFSIYTVVGLLLMGLLSTYKIKENWRMILSILLGMIYAVSDEIHQSFIPGRTPQITDVYIDTLGVVLGILLILLGIKIYEQILQKYYKNITKSVNKCHKKYVEKKYIL